MIITLSNSDKKVSMLAYNKKAKELFGVFARINKEE
jgi:hypothetical protein